MKTECRRCQGFLKYEEDQWGGHQLCVACGWESMVYRVSEDREEAIMRHQLHNGQREGIAVGRASLSGVGIPADRKKRLQGGAPEQDQIATTAMGKAR